MTSSARLGSSDQSESSPEEIAALATISQFALRGPGERVALIPHLMGFQPERGDITILVFRHGSLRLAQFNHTGAAIDLPRLWPILIGELRLTGADTVYVVADLPASAELDLLVFELGVGSFLVEVVRVDEGRWWYLSGPDADRGWPREGALVTGLPEGLPRSLTDPVGAGTVPDRADLRKMLRPGSVALSSQMTQLLQNRTQGERGTSEDGAGTYDLLVAAHNRCAADRSLFTLEQAAALIEAIQDFPAGIRCLVWDDDAAWWLWLTLLRYAPSSHAPALTTLVATTAYQRARVGVAVVAAGESLDRDPDDGIARFVVAMAAGGATPAEFADCLREVVARTEPTS